MRLFGCVALVLLLSIFTAYGFPSKQTELIELSVIHINDFHARYEETNLDSGLCKTSNCIGGFSRLFASVMKIIEEKPHSILLNAGDNFEGTLWYDVHKWNVTQYFFNKLPTDAFTLGNHEFEDKIAGLVPFLEQLKAPVVVSNIDATREPSIQNLFNKSVVIERHGLKIGIIGVILSTINEIADIGNLILLKESESVNTEAERLVREEGVFTNIVLSHCGYDVEKAIAANATSKISLVVGGHTHSFLYTGEPVPGTDIPVGPYPTIVQNKEGKKVLVVQASSYTKYLGNISLFYNNFGEVVNWTGAPVFMDSKLPQDKEVNEELQPWKKQVDANEGNRIIGQTMVRLEQSSCPMAECLMGNFITDAMVFGYLDHPEPGTWTNASIAMMHAGGLRSGIDIGSITYYEATSIAPFNNTIDIGEIQGKHLKEIFESSTSDDGITLLQVAGLKIVYNLTMPEGSRVTFLQVRCRKCTVPVYEDLKDEEMYRVVLPSFLAEGGFGFTLFKKYFKNRQIGGRDRDLFVRYVEICLKCCVVNYSIKFAMQTFLPIVLFLKIVLCAQFNLTIIHFNDFHARYEPVDNLSTTCEGDNCIGGFSRLYSKITQLKNETPNSLLLNAGDNFQGTLWYIVHKWNVTQHFLNKLPFDAITLGNHEFDDGIAGLVPYLNHIKAPVIVSNIDDSKEPRFQNLTRKSVIVEKGGKKIGIIGVLTTSTKLTSRTENLTFQNELESVNSEAKKLQELGVFTIIVLSHCGYEADLEIAQKSNFKISVIVGGHTDTFLYSGSPVPGPDKPSGPYPTPVLNINGGTVLVVQASAYTKYLGDLKVIYDELGNLTGWGGNPVFLGPETPSDGEIDAELEVWKKDVDLEGGKIVGNSKLAMRNKPCRSEECPLGNFATDAMVENNNTCNLAMIHAGGMRAGIETGNITFNQLISTFPFQDTINLCEIKGEHLVKILESCVDDNHLKWPHLFQVSGFKIVFNVSNPEGGRVQSVKTSCRECADPIYENLVLEKYYRVFLPTFLTDTDFNPLFKKYIRNKIIGDRDSDVYVRYLGKHSPLWARVEDRIKIVS
ncbi:Apyrase-like Protein [Tribolium castaneum]|uniref:apyrase n=1 Tax=Tribolium castaneum TaxID=7070 RepID=A0A139WMA1_TRICA|nr:Apyrase-like Protein [Tribolium castaneum]